MTLAGAGVVSICFAPRALPVQGVQNSPFPARHRAGVCGSSTLGPRAQFETAEVARYEGIPVVTPLRAILDGIARHLDSCLLDQAATNARGRGLILEGELADVEVARR